MAFPRSIWSLLTIYLYVDLANPLTGISWSRLSRTMANWFFWMYLSNHFPSTLHYWFTVISALLDLLLAVMMISRRCLHWLVRKEFDHGFKKWVIHWMKSIVVSRQFWMARLVTVWWFVVKEEIQTRHIHSPYWYKPIFLSLETNNNIKQGMNVFPCISNHSEQPWLTLVWRPVNSPVACLNLTSPFSFYYTTHPLW